MNPTHEHRPGLNHISAEEFKTQPEEVQEFIFGESITRKTLSLL